MNKREMKIVQEIARSVAKNTESLQSIEIRMVRATKSLAAELRVRRVFGSLNKALSL